MSLAVINACPSAMLSPSKLAALRLSLQPLTAITGSSFTASAPSAAPPTPMPLSGPIKPRLSPIPDASMCSPTPTRASFLLTPTRYGLYSVSGYSSANGPMSPSSPSSMMVNLSPTDPRSPILSICVTEGCENLVQSVRNACAQCRSAISDILAGQIGLMQMRSPTDAHEHSKNEGLHNMPQKSLKRANDSPFRRTPLSPKPSGVAQTEPAKREVSLSATHPRPHPIQFKAEDRRAKTTTLRRRQALASLEEESEATSPDALYFGKRARTSMHDQASSIRRVVSLGGHNEVQ